ncbi:MAG: 4-hydroxy-tetrahydrodipicolinate synthase [Micromonosporaceae bacterium]
MSLEEVRSALESVVAITVTPFDAGGGVDTRAYATIVDRCVRAGVRAVTPNGNTSEFYSLDPEELATAVDATVAAVAGRATVIAGVGHDAVRAARSARLAEVAGAQAVMVHQPVHPYQSLEGWVDYHRAVAQAVPDLGVVCYVRSPHVTADAFVALADSCPNVVGVKYAVPDVITLPDLVRAVGAERWVWVCGLAETWAPYFWVAGARGFTSGLANVAPAESLALLAALRRSDYRAAMTIWERLRPFEDMRARAASAANVSVVKEALHHLGLCRPEVRPPISRLAPEDRDQVAKIVSELSTS